MNTLFRRRNYLIDREAQSRFITGFAVASLAGGVVAVAYFIYFARIKIEETLYSMKLPDMPMGHLLINEMLIAIGIGLLFVVILFLFTSDMVFSRIEKPLIKMATVIHNISLGNLQSEVMLGENDEFQYLARELDGLVHEMNQKITSIRTRADRIILLTDRNRQDATERDRQEIAHQIAAIQNELKGLSMQPA